MHVENRPRCGIIALGMGAVLAVGLAAPAQQAVYPEWEAGMQCYKAKDFACCAAEFTKVVDLAVRDNSDPSGAYYMAGRCYMAKRDLTNAERSFMKVLERTPNNGSTLVQLALIAKQRNENDKAIQFVNQGIGSVTEPGDKFLAFKVRGGAYLALNKNNEAAKDLQEALAIAPKDVDILTLLGNLAAEMKDNAKATDLYIRAYNVSPSTERAQRLIEMAFKAKKYEVVTKIGQDILDKGVKDSAILTKVGLANLAVKQFDKAVGSLSQVPGTTLEKISGLAQAYVGLSSWGEAEKYMLEWQKLDPKNSAVYDGLGRVYLAQDRPKEALQWYERGLSNTGDPKFTDLASKVRKRLQELAPTAAPVKKDSEKS